MENKFAKSLLEKYIAGTCTAEETAAVEAWYAQWNENLPENLPEEKLELAMERVYQRLPKEEQPNYSTGKVKKLSWLATAAAVLLISGIAVWIYTSQHSGSNTHVNTQLTNDILPGKNTALLTLTNGKRIKLSDAKTGVVINARELSYEDGTAVASGILNNQAAVKQDAAPDLGISTPRGGTYQIVLPDGSKVWLNAASEIKFPASFEQTKTRTVKLIGEAYFEVAKDKNKPFIVETEQQQVKVLGTHFNINAYPDEKRIRTTLLEGSVQLAYGAKDLILKPGQQTSLTGKNIELSDVDTEEAIAWKNGNFVFNDEDLQSIMRKVARWYDVEVVYQDQLPETSFLGALSRSKNLSALLKVLESSGKIHFKIEGRRVIVMH